MKNGSSVSSDFPVLVLGASAGGLLPLQEVLSAFPADLEVAVLIVQHIPAHAESHLAEILSTRCKLEVVQAEDGMVLRPGRVYTPVPDYHLLVDNDRVIIAKGPRENRFRPAIDALFRSSAYHYGSRVLGVVLSGALDDGTSGLYAIKRAGGVVLVQTPGEAAFRSMPDSAIDNVRVDYVLTAAEWVRESPLFAKAANLRPKE